MFFPILFYIFALNESVALVQSFFDMHWPTRSSSSSLCVVGEGVPRTDRRKSSYLPSNTDLV